MLDRQEMLLLAGVIGIPAIVFTAGFFFIRKKIRNPQPGDSFEMVLLGRRLVVSREMAMVALYAFFVYFWLDLFMPFGGALLFLGATLFGFARVRRFKIGGPLTLGTELNDRLGALSSELKDVSVKIGELTNEVIARQRDLEEKAKLVSALEGDIAKKSAEADTWKQLSESEKQLVIGAASDAFRKESRGSFWWGLALGFLINVLASAAWALMGAPSRTEMIEMLKEIWK